MIYTTDKLYEALRQVIVNMPERASAVTISLKAGDVAPLLHCTAWAMEPTEEKPFPKEKTERFYLVEVKDWEKVEKALEDARSNWMEIES